MVSRWCNKCSYEPYGNCGYQCPVFGLSFEELAEKVNKQAKEIDNLQFMLQYLRETNPMAYNRIYDECSRR